MTAATGAKANWGLTVLLVALVLTAVEVGLRIFPPVNTYDGWDNRTLFNKVQNASESPKNATGSWDTLVLGSSVGLPLVPERWRETMCAAPGTQTFYNACLGGQRPDMLGLLFERVFVPMGQPAKLIYIITPTDVNAGTDYRAGAFSLWHAPRVRALNPELGVVSRALAFCETHCAILSMRRHLRGLLSNGPQPEEPLIEFLPDGARLSPTLTATAESARAIHPLENFTPGEKYLQAIVRTAQYCRENGVELTMVSQPLPDCAYSQCLTTSETAAVLTKYEAALCEIETKTGRWIVRLSDGQTTFPDTMGYDSLHANRWGAEALMAEYWSRVVMPDSRVEFSVDFGFRFADFVQGRSDVVLQDTGQPWSTQGVSAAPGVRTVAVMLPTAFAPGHYLCTFTVDPTHSVLSVGDARATTVSAVVSANHYERVNGIARAEVSLDTTGPLCVQLETGTRADSVFVRRVEFCR